MLRVPCNLSKLTRLQVVLLVGIPQKVVHALKSAAHEEHPTNILRKEKHAHGMFLALPKVNVALKTTKWLQIAKY